LPSLFYILSYNKLLSMKKVFLGGTCNGSAWRDAFIKDLQIDYFQPQGED
jgi:hypothetical protein